MHAYKCSSIGDIFNQSVSVTNSKNGIRIKTVYGATGSVSGVMYEDITLSNISKYDIVIEQDYENGSLTGTPTTGVPVHDLAVSDVAASAHLSATDVYIFCDGGSCSS
jgi:polygalacturonase